MMSASPHLILHETSQKLLDDAETNTLRVLEVYCEIMQEMRGELDKTGNEFSANDFMQMGRRDSDDLMADASGGINGHGGVVLDAGKAKKVEELNKLITSIQSQLHRALDSVQSLEPVKHPAYHPISAENITHKRSHVTSAVN